MGDMDEATFNAIPAAWNLKAMFGTIFTIQMACFFNPIFLVISVLDPNSSPSFQTQTITDPYPSYPNLNPSSLHIIAVSVDTVTYEIWGAVNLNF